MPKVNLKGVSTSFELLPDGDYTAIFTKFTNGKTAKNDDKVSHEFTIVTPEELKGRKAFRTFTLTENALWAWKGEAVAMGADPEALESEDVDTDEVLTELLNNDMNLRISHHADPNDPKKIYNDVSVVADNSW